MGFDHVKRAFRGMPEGVIMYSNLAYLAGKLQMISFINGADMTAQELLAYMARGKFNPIDNEQVGLMHEAGEPQHGWL